MMHRREFIGIATLALLLLAGCGKQPAEDLRGKVAGLEQELAGTRAELQGASVETAELRTKLREQQATIDGLTMDLVQVKVQRDKLKQEVAALKKTRR